MKWQNGSEDRRELIFAELSLARKTVGHLPGKKRPIDLARMEMEEFLSYAESVLLDASYWRDVQESDRDQAVRTQDSLETLLESCR